MSWEARADLVIVGTGVAGLAAALAATRKKVTLNDLTRQALNEFLQQHGAEGLAAV